MGTTAQKLQYLSDAKSSIKTAIEGKGVTVGNSAFGDYGNLIDSIPTGGQGYVLATFKNYDGEILQAVNVISGSAPQYTGATPQKIEEGNSWVFSGWSPQIGSIEQDTEYTAQFTQEVFTVRWFNGETLLETQTATYGQDLTFTGTAPSEQGKYFIGWIDSTRRIQNAKCVTGDLDLYAELVVPDVLLPGSYSSYSWVDIAVINQDELIVYRSGRAMNGHLSISFASAITSSTQWIRYKDSIKIFRIQEGLTGFEYNFPNVNPTYDIWDSVIFPSTFRYNGGGYNTMLSQTGTLNCRNLYLTRFEQLFDISSYNQNQYFSFMRYSGNKVYSKNRSVYVYEIVNATFNHKVGDVLINNKFVKTATVASGIQSVESKSLQYCTALITVTLPTSVTAIGANAFEGCSSLLNIDLSHVASIGVSGFLNCISMRAIKIPPMTSIGNVAFAGCTGLLYYDFTDWTTTDLDNCTFGTNIFSGLPANARLYFKDSETAEYAKTISNLATYANYITYVGA